MSSILDHDTVSLDEGKNALVIIDQTLLPTRTVMLKLTDLKDIWDAIYLLKVRGAPAIGVAPPRYFRLWGASIPEPRTC